MNGLDGFLSTFGDITLTQIVGLVLASVSCWRIYLQIKKFFDNKKDLLIKKHEAEEEKDKQLKMVLEEVNKYPKYREQSRKIQQDFQHQIDNLNGSQEKLAKAQTEIRDSLKDLKEAIDKRERNKLQDRLLQSYRYYTDPVKNPNQTISSMESQAFWALFSDYEDVGGDGYMHTVVMPAMKMLKVVEKE